MPKILVNIDVPELDAAVEFYGRAFGFTVGRRFGRAAVELLGGEVPVYLLKKKVGTPVSEATSQVRDYGRHWTPVHLDLVVDDVEVALARAREAGATVEGPVRASSWGKMALLADPWGHGVCLLQFVGRGYDEIAS